MLVHYSGYIPAMVTPFKDGKLDVNSFEKYMEYLINSEVSSVVVCGSTGESLSLSIFEKIELIKTAAKIINGRIKLICGVIDSTTENCRNIMQSVDDIVDAFLCICPFYIKPSQNQMYNHFKLLSQLTEKDIILYNNPSRVGSNIGFETLKKLCEFKNIVAIKECTSDLSIFTTWRTFLKDDFVFLSGNDDTACAALAMGAEGVISVTANVTPKLCNKLYSEFKNRNVEEFKKLRDSLAPLHTLMFKEPTPAPAKYVLNKLGLMNEDVRMPLSSISTELKKEIDVIIDNLRLLTK